MKGPQKTNPLILKTDLCGKKKQGKKYPEEKVLAINTEERK